MHNQYEYTGDFCCQYFRKKAIDLSKTYDEQIELLPDQYLANLPLDIASEWDVDAYNYILNKAIEAKVFDEEIVDLIKTISMNFSKNGYGGWTEDGSLWTLEGLKNHQLWEKQRKLAKKLIVKLDSIKKIN